MSKLQEILTAQIRMWRNGKIVQGEVTTKVMDQGIPDEMLVQGLISTIDMDTVADHYGYRKIGNVYMKDME